MMNNYLPMYDTVGYRASAEQATVAQDIANKEDKYAKLLQIQEDECSVYQEPEHNHSRFAKKAVQKLKTCVVILSLVVIFLLIVITVGIALTTTVWRCNSSRDRLHFTQTEKCKADTINCSAYSNQSSCQTGPIKIPLPVSKRKEKEFSEVICIYFFRVTIQWK